MNDSFYIEGANRMIDEGLEMASKIINYLRMNDARLSKLDRTECKKTILVEQPDFNTFASIHPIVYEYIVSEKVFNRTAFKKYIKAVFGTPKSQEDQERMAKDKKYVYFLKNKQYAMYYKFLLQETNKHASKNTINKMYEEAVSELDRHTTHMLTKYEEEHAKLEQKNGMLEEEKRAELVAALKKNLAA